MLHCVENSGKSFTRQAEACGTNKTSQVIIIPGEIFGMQV